MEIRNIKISVKLEEISLDSACRLLEKEKLSYKSYPSYITFKRQYNFVLYKTSKNKTNHLNATGLKGMCDVDSCLKEIFDLLNKNVILHKIDNITATYNLSKLLCIDELSKKIECAKYNAERFPGMFVKCADGCAIIFHSGKVVLLGCKNIYQLWNVVEFVRMNTQ